MSPDHSNWSRGIGKRTRNARGPGRSLSFCNCCLIAISLFLLSFSVFTLSMPLFCHALGCYQEGITAVEHKVLPLLPFLSSLSLSLSLLCTQALFIECNVTHATVRSLPALNTAHTTLTLSSSIQRPCPCSIFQSM